MAAVDIPWTSYPYVFDGSGDGVTTLGASFGGSGVPSIGNGVLSLRGQRQSGVFAFNFIFVVGSTTNMGTGAGAFTFSLPSHALADVVGFLPLQQTTLTYYAAAAFIDQGGGAGNVRYSASAFVSTLILGAGAGFSIIANNAIVDLTHPFSWGTTGDTLVVTGAVEGLGS